MILDKNLQTDPAATAITVTAASANVIDLLNARDMGVGDAYERMELVVTVGTAFAAAGAATLTIQISGSVDNITWTIYGQTDAIPKANLGAGTVIRLPVPPRPPHSAGLPRYYRANYVVATGPFTAGTVESDFVPVAHQANNPESYPPGVTVSN